MEDKTSKSSSHRMVSHQIETARTELPLPNCWIPSTPRKALLNKSRVWGMLKGSFDMLRAINSPNLCESSLSDKIHDGEQACSKPATQIAIIKWQDNKSWWFSSYPVGTTSNLGGKSDFFKNSRRLREDRKILPGDIPPFNFLELYYYLSAYRGAIENHRLSLYFMFSPSCLYEASSQSPS